jgi:hypothetical protein
MNSELTVLFVVAFIASILGSEVGYRRKGLKRCINSRLAVHCCSGFVGALLVLIVLSRVANYQLFVAILVGAFYGYFMANAKVYNEIR